MKNEQGELQLEFGYAPPEIKKPRDQVVVVPPTSAGTNTPAPGGAPPQEEPDDLKRDDYQ